MFEDTIYTFDLLEGIKLKDSANINPYEVKKPPKWCSKIWFLLHVRYNKLC